MSTSDAGHVVKELGESGGLVAADGETIVFELTVEEVEERATCPGRTGDVVRAENGAFVVLTVTAALDASYAEIPGQGEDPFMPLLAESFHLADSSGAELPSHSDAAWLCFEEELARSFLDPGMETSGLIVLDGPAGAERVVFDPDGTGGWVWDLRAD